MCEHTQKVSVLSKNKLLGLEVIRFISALSVLVWHYQHFFYISDKPSNFVKEQQPAYLFFQLFYDYGNYGVQVFWCISGFIFFWKYRNSIAEKHITSIYFFILRFSRLYPLHFVTLLLVALLQAMYFSINNYYFVYQNNDIAHFGLQMLLASNWGFEKGSSFNGPIWSISVEVVVYFVFFLILRIVGRSPVVNIYVLLLCMVATLLKLNTPIVDCLMFFYAGGLSAMARQYLEDKKYKIYINTLAFAALVFIPVILYWASVYFHKNFSFLFSILYIPTLIFASAINISVPPKVQKIVEVAGNMTYSSYLIHFPIQLLIALYFSYVNQIIPYYSELFFSVFMLFTLVVSYYIYRFFELPAQTYIRVNVSLKLTN